MVVKQEVIGRKVMKCQNCGFECKETDNFCKNCGEKLKVTKKYCQNSEEELNKEKENCESNINKLKSNDEDFEVTANTVCGKHSYIKTGITILVFALLLFIIVKYYKLANLNTPLEDVKQETEENNLSISCKPYNDYLKTNRSLPILKKEKNLSELIINLKHVQDYMELYLNCDNSVSTPEKEEMFARYLKVIAKYNEYNTDNILKSFVDQENYIISDKNLSNINQQVAEVGLRVDMSETVYYLEEDKKYTFDKFSKYLPKDWQEYLLVRSKLNKQYYNDGYVAISPTELKNVVMSYEKFYNAHPSFLFIKDETLSSPSLGIYSGDFVNNKSMYGHEQDYIKAYIEYLEEYPQTKLKPLLLFRIADIRAEDTINNLDIDDNYDNDNVEANYINKEARQSQYFFIVSKELNPYYNEGDEYNDDIYFDFNITKTQLQKIYKNSQEYCAEKPVEGTGSFYICVDEYFNKQAKNYNKVYSLLEDYCRNWTSQAEQGKCIQKLIDKY